MRSSADTYNSTYEPQSSSGTLGAGIGSGAGSGSTMPGSSPYGTGNTTGSSGLVDTSALSSSEGQYNRQYVSFFFFGCSAFPILLTIVTEALAVSNLEIEVI